MKVYKISADYNVSGNGDGNLIDEDTEWVQLETTDPNYGRWDRALYKDDNRADFCRHFGEVIAYVWDEWDRNDFLKSVFARLDLSQAATVDSTADTEVVSRKRKPDDNKINFMHSMNTMSLIELSRAQRAEEAQILDYEMKMMDYGVTSRPHLLLKKMADKAQVRADMLGDEICKLRTTSTDS